MVQVTRCGITCIILRIMNATSVSQSMGSPNQAPSTDVGFVSLTKCLVDTSEAKPHCPECKAEIDFSRDIEWLGPTAFICRFCEKVIELDRILDF